MGNTACVTHLRDNHLVTLERGEDGWIVARCEELGVITQGRSIGDAKKNALEAVGLMREELGKDEEFNILTRRLF